MSRSVPIAVTVVLLAVLSGAAIGAQGQPGKPDEGAKPAPSPKENAGQEDLNKATEARLDAKTLSDLGEVIKLCKKALEKGLDEGNTKYAKTLLGSTLIQRGSAVASAVLEGSLLDPRMGQFRRVALADLELGVSMSPEQPEALLLIAKLNLLPGGDTKRAAKALDDCIALKDGDPRKKAEALIARAGLQKDDEKRLADLNEAVRLAPGEPAAVRARGLVHADQGKLDLALADLEAAIKLEPEHARTYELKALVLAKQEKYDEALAALAQARKVEPKSVGPLVQQARVHALQMNLQAALDDLNQAHALEPDNLGVLLFRANIHQELKDNDKAMADVNRALKLRPGLPPAVRFRAMLLADAKKMDLAISELQQLLKKSPDDVPALLQLAMLHTADDRPRKAIEIYTQVLAKEPEDWMALRGRGDALLSIAKQAEAIADYEKALKLRPEDDGILNNLAWVLATSPDAKLRNGKRAIELATKACKVTEYKAAHILSTLGAAYAETGDFKTAKKWSKKAIELGREDQKEELKKELASYEQRKPCRELQQTPEKPEPKPKPKPKPKTEKPKPKPDPKDVEFL